jgi:hypothetical protein
LVQPPLLHSHRHHQPSDKQHIVVLDNHNSIDEKGKIFNF